MLRNLIMIATLLMASPTWASELPPGKNREKVEGTCGACHSLKLVTQNRMTRKHWDQTLTWMQKKHNLWDIPKEDREKILDYLGTYLSPETSEAKNDLIRGRRVNPLPHKTSGG